jgi:hypothetical protein
MLDFDDQTVIIRVKADPQRGHDGQRRQHDDRAKSLRVPKQVEKTDKSARGPRSGQRRTRARGTLAFLVSRRRYASPDPQPCAPT